MRLPLLALTLALVFAVAPFSHAAEKGANTLSGTVVETMNSGGYSYMLVNRGKDKIWVAVPEMKVKVGQKVDLIPGMEMGQFSSKTLKRTFDRIIFSSGPATAAAAPSSEAMNKAHAGVDMAAQKAPAVAQKVEKAKGANAYTVAEIHEKRGALDKKRVSIRGKVVKAASGIMGKNWLHLQDGSGAQAKGTNDLVVTTTEMAAVGSVVTVTGVVAKDKDFGAGYKYTVVVEEAKLTK